MCACPLVSRFRCVCVWVWVWVCVCLCLRPSRGLRLQCHGAVVATRQTQEMPSSAASCPVRCPCCQSVLAISLVVAPCSPGGHSMVAVPMARVATDGMAGQQPFSTSGAAAAAQVGMAPQGTVAMPKVSGGQGPASVPSQVALPAPTVSPAPPPPPARPPQGAATQASLPATGLPTPPQGPPPPGVLAAQRTRQSGSSSFRRETDIFLLLAALEAKGEEEEEEQEDEEGDVAPIPKQQPKRRREA